MNIKHIKGIILLGLVASIGLPSCHMLSKYQSPEYDAQNLYRNEASTDTLSIANLSWKEYFQDPLLQALIDEGLEKNFDLQIAYLRVQQAEANLSMARAAYFPTISLVGQYNDTRLSNGAGGKDILGYSTGKQYGLGIAASWEADIWGKLNRKSKAAHAQFLSTQEYKNLIQTSLISNIAISYYSLLALDEQLRVTNETVVILKESASTIASMKEAGMLTGAAVEQSKALLYGTQVSIPSLEMQISQLENTVSVMLGRKPGSVVRSTMKDQPIMAQMEFGVPAQMLAKRPDVRQAEFGFRSAFELTNAARASFYPSLTLNQGSMIGFMTNFTPENLMANILTSITQPIFAKKQLTTQLKVAKLQQQEALLTFHSTVLSAGKEVSDILNTYKLSISKNELRQNQVKSLSTAVYFTQELLKGAEATYTEVLNAEQGLLQAQLGQVGDKLEQLQATVNLYRALGGGTN